MTKEQVITARGLITSREDGSTRFLVIRTEEARIYRSNTDVLKWDDENGLLYIIRYNQDNMTPNVQANYPVEVIATFYDRIVNMTCYMAESEIDYTAGQIGYSESVIIKIKKYFSTILANVTTHVADKNKRESFPESDITLL